MSESNDIQFVLRKRQRKRPEFWSVTYDPHDGKILNIEPGEKNQAGVLIVTYAKIKDILSGKTNQNDYAVDYNEKIGVIDLVDVKETPIRQNSQQIWNQWLTHGFNQHGIKSPDLKCIMFLDAHKLRVEASRTWATKIMETLSSPENFTIYLTDAEDPHLLLGFVDISMVLLIEKGYQEVHFEKFLSSAHIDDILDRKQSVRINVPPVAKSLGLTKEKSYYPFTGIADDQTLISHGGPGKQITVFVENSKLWARSDYTVGCPIDAITGNLKAGIFVGEEPDNFWGWVEFPALMLRQNQPFELVKNWPEGLHPKLLYKANSVDIGVLEVEDTYQRI